MNLVTVATFTYPNEAYVLKSRLEAEGIHCHLKDLNTISVHPFYSNALGGIKLQVLQDDVLQAKKIVDEYYANTQNENTPDIPEEEYAKKKEPEGKIICPVCGSDDVRIDKTPSDKNLFGYLAAFRNPFAFLLLLGKKKYHCFNCGHNFKPAK